jgi:CheY-like chemotaxis protein
VASCTSVLIVDDDPRFNADLSQSLLESGYRVAQADTARAAQQLLTSDRFRCCRGGSQPTRREWHRADPSDDPPTEGTAILATTGVESDLYLEIAGSVGAHRTIRKRPASPDSTFPADEWKRALASVLASPPLPA